MKILISTLLKNQLVLAKILDTLKPDYILLWDTTYGRKWDLDKKAESTVKMYRYEKGFSKFSFKILIDDKFENPNRLFEEIDEFLNRDNFTKEIDIFIDVTGGRGLTASYLTFFANQSDKRIKISYCDYKSNSLIFYTPKDTKLKIEKKPIKLNFAIKSLENRLKINNVSVDKNYLTLYRNGKSDYFKDKIEDMELFLGKMNDEKFRKLFNSYYELLITWIKKAELPNLKEIEDFGEVFKNTISKSLDEIFVDSISLDSKNNINEIIFKVLKTSYSNDFSTKNVFSKTEGEFDEIFNQIRGILANEVIKKIDDEFKNDKKQNTKKLFNRIKLTLKSEINLYSLKINDKLTSTHFSSKYHKDMIDNYCKNELKDDRLIKILQNKKISMLFEDIVSYKIYEIIKKRDDLAEKIAGVYGNVKLGTATEKNYSEIDTFILLKSGNVINYEVKQHYNSFKFKDLDARIKNIKDLVGSETNFRLVFPLYSDDLDLDNPSRIEKHNTWIDQIGKLNERKKEFKVVFFDKIEKELERDLLKNNIEEK